MTAFYCFESKEQYLSMANRNESEYIIPNVASVSVVGEHYAPEPVWTEEDPRPEDFEPYLIGFLVNTSKPIPEWAAYRCFPDTPMRIFG